MGFGVKFKLVNSKETFHIISFAFMNDTNLVKMVATANEALEVVYEQAERGINTFVGEVMTTGGQAKPIKIACYMMDFQWDSRQIKWEYTNVLTSEEMEEGETLTVKNGDRNRILISHHNLSKRSKIFGFLIALDGNNTMVIQKVIVVATEWADRVHSGNFSKKDAWVALNALVLKKMEYLLLTLNLSKDECDKIEMALFKAGLPKIYTEFSTPQDVVYDLYDHQGASLHPLYSTMILKHIKGLVTEGGYDIIT